MAANDDLKVFTVEYRLTGGGRFDAVTPAPGFSTDPRDPDYVEPSEDQIFRFDLTQNIGIIDPDFDATDGTEGDRFITLLDIELPESGAIGVGVIVLEDLPPDGFAPQELVLSATGQRAYSCGCIFVPQGSVLVIFSDVVSPEEYFLRYSAIAAESKEMLARYIDACCCTDQRFPITVCDPPVIDEVLSSEFQRNPAYIDPNATGDLSVIGSGFTNTDVFELVGPEPVPEVIGVNFIDDSNVIISVSAADVVLGSVWTLRACRADDPGCCSELADAIEAPPCLRFSRINPDIGLLNTGTVSIQVTGYGFETVGPVNVSLSQGGTDIAVGASLVIADNQNLSFDAQTNAALLGAYDLVITPDRLSGCPQLTVPNAFTVSTP